MENDIKGKVVIVTGAARGIGQEYVRCFAAAGAHVVAVDIADCAETIALAKKAGGEVLGVTLDVVKAESAAEMAQAAKQTFGGIDALVNNAALYGQLRGGRFETIPEADWDAAMAVNVKGIWNCCKAVVPVMREAKHGSIVNVASLAATYGTPYVLHYTTSKAAVIGMTRGLARELGRDGIRVNGIAPTAVLTEATRQFFGDRAEKALEIVKAGQAIQKNLKPSDLTGTVMWLISNASNFVTGQTISVDGGTVMN